MKRPHIFRRKHSIARRLTWRVILAMTLVFTTISVFLFTILWVVGSAFLSKMYANSMEVSNEKINNVFSNIEIAVNNNLPEAESNISNVANPFLTQERLLQLNPKIVGAAIAFNPNSKRMKGKVSAAYVYRDSTGIHPKQLNNKKYDYLHQEWFSKPCVEGKGSWSEPYVDDGGGEIPMITYSLPLIDDNSEVYAVMTADVALDWIRELSLEIDDDILSFTDEEISPISFIATSQGTFVAHTDNSLVFHETLQDFFAKRTDRSEEVTRRLLNDNSFLALYYDHDEHYQVVLHNRLKSNGWVVCTVVPAKDILEPVNAFIIGFVIIMLVGLCIVSFVCYLTIRRVTKPLRKFTDSVDEITKGNLNTPLPEIKTKDEMLRLRNSFELMQTSLIKQIEETRSVNEEKGRMESELQIARNIQMSMLPKTFPPYPERDDVDIFGQQTPAKEVGGDLFDFFIRDEKLYFCVGDVSGKGVPASLLMAVTRSLFRTISSHESQPARILTGINESISEDNDSNMFVTLFIGVLDLPTGRLRYSNAGHDAPLLIGNYETSLLLCDPNLPAGILADWHFSSQETVIAPQTTIFLYTDGLTEAENIHHEQFQEKRMFDTTNQSERQPQKLIEKMTEAVHQFVGEAEPSDDQTMLAIQYTKEQDECVCLSRSITLTNNIDEIPQLAAFVDEVCEAVGFDMSLTMSMNLAIEEAVVNVMDYAYPVGTKGNILIEAKVNASRLKFVISDWGTPFDPTAKSEVDTTLPAEERPIGGLGIHLVRQLMDSINYERIDGKNVLTLRKKLV